METSHELKTFEENELNVYLGRDFHVNKYVTIHPPSIGEVLDFGEENYFPMICSFTAIPSDLMSTLEDMGVDYESISDFELFSMMTRGYTPTQSSILFGDVNFSRMELFTDSTNGKQYMCDRESQTIIDELAYIKITSCLRKMHLMGDPKVKHATTKTVKKLLLDLDRSDKAKARKDGYKSFLLPLISAMSRYPGFPYKTKELVDCGLYEFLDRVQGAQIYLGSTALLTGSYSGMIDTSKINKEHFNWMRRDA